MEEVKKRYLRLPAKMKNSAADLLSTAIWIAASFAASRVFIFGRLSPFGAAAAAASGRNYALASALGAALGYIFSGNPENTLRYIGAVLMVFGIRLLTERLFSGDIPAVLTAAGATAVASFGYAAATVISGYNGALALAETVLAAGITYFFRRTAAAFEHGKPVLSLSGGDRACVIITAATAAASLASVTFGKISIGGIAASATVLLAAKYGKESGGAVAGVAAGAAMAFSSSFMSTELSAYSLGGLICGVFSAFGKIGAVLSFIGVRLLFCLLSAADYPEFSPVYESVIAAGIFMLIPEKAGRFISAVTIRNESLADSGTVKELVLSKMGRAADGLSDMSTAVKKVFSALEKEVPENMSTVLNLAAKQNCAGCSKCGECWGNERKTTENAFLEMGEAVKNGKSPSALDFCPNAKAIAEDVRALEKENRRKYLAEKKENSIKKIINDQFDALALFLRDTASEAADIKNVDKKLSLAVRNVFEGRGFPLFACTCYYTSEGCIEIEVSGAKERLKKADLAEITEDISDICCCEIAKPVKRDTENARRLMFFEKPCMEAVFGKASINAEGEKFCGDYAEYFSDANGRAHMVLSDGMGSGEHAALGAMMTSALVSRMIRAGFRFGSAIKLVNGALLLKGDEEALATIDGLSVNLYSGTANFYKAGAEASFVLKGGKTSKIESISLPAGILCGAEYEQSSIRLGLGDIVVLVTDGVTSFGSEWVPSELRSLAEKPPEEIAAKLAETAKARRNDGHSDDITVAVMKLVSAD